MDNSPESSVTEDSQETPPNNHTHGFSFKLQPARKLKHAIEALCDPIFNPTGRGRIDVDSRKFTITARSASNVFGYLLLDRLDNDLQCRTPINGNKVVNLSQISAFFIGRDEETVTVFQAEDTEFITIMFGEEPTPKYTAELFDNNGQIPKMPFFNGFCGTDLLSEDMHLLVTQLFRDGMPQLVSVSITRTFVRVVMGNEPPIKTLTYTLDNMYPGFTYGMDEHDPDPWRRHQAFFYWTYPGVLLKAARLFHCYSVYFAISPPKHVILQFTLQQLGNLFFLMKSAQIRCSIARRFHSHE